MQRSTHFFIDGRWIAPAVPREAEVINPADERPFAIISLGSPPDVDAAVAAARRAFDCWAAVPKREKLAWLGRLLVIYRRRMPEMALAISTEMGAPITLATEAQAAVGASHIAGFIRALEGFEFEHPRDGGREGERILHEPIGVAGLITPWNWPMNQVTLKVVPAIAVGCTVVLKPSEIAPISSLLFAEILEESGLPPGVFNLINGDGAGVGAALSAHPDVDMVSFTGSTRAGVAVSMAAAATVKRVTLELGGKSPNILFADCDLERAVAGGVAGCFQNTGQSCDAPTRMLVERSVYDAAVAAAERHAAAVRVGDPSVPGDHLGPLASAAQYAKVQEMIEVALAEGARLVAGGTGRPEGIERGYYARPTVFADVNNRMRIAREEVFGPVLAMIPFDGEDEAVAIANDTPYGLAAYVQTGDDERLRRVARRLRAGMVHANGTYHGSGSPFGGYKQSGLGREGGRWGLEDFLEVKAVSGWR